MPTARAGLGAVWSGRGRPANGIGLRNANANEFRIATSDGSLIGTVDGARAFRLVHPGSIYLHQGTAWRVSELDLDDHVAIVEPHDGGEYTQPRAVTDIRILQTDEEREIGNATVFRGGNHRHRLPPIRHVHTRTTWNT